MRRGRAAALSRGLALDPTNPEVTQHMYQLGDDSLRWQTRSMYQQTSEGLGEAIPLKPSAVLHSFHLHTDARSIVQQVFKAYGIDAMIDDSVRSTPIRFEVDDASFADAMRVLSLATNSFYVPVDERDVLVARDTRANRTQFSRQLVETIFLSGLTDTQMTEVHNLAIERIRNSVSGGRRRGGNRSQSTTCARCPANSSFRAGDGNGSGPARGTAFYTGDNDQFNGDAGNQHGCRHHHATRSCRRSERL